MTTKELAVAIAKKVNSLGGKTYFVGGCVRDELLGVPVKDIDIEVHGITVNQLRSVLALFNGEEPVATGKSFGVFGVKGYDLDIAMPRKERVTGDKHTDFEVTVDPFLGEYEASRRRDFTINALMKDVLTGEVKDFWGGMQDLSDGIIRHIDDEKFSEDTLRVLRAARFSAKLNFSIAMDTKALCRLLDLSHLSKERVMGELQTALLKSPKPSVFFEAMRDFEQLDVWFPELKQTIDSPQSKVYHAEGDVWTHTMMVLDEAAKRKDKAENPVGFLMSAVCHDFGKPLCTTVDENGGVHCHGHETEGIPAVKAFMHRLTTEKKLASYVLNMTKLHMKPHRCVENASSYKKTNHMFDEAICPNDLVLLAIADDAGRICNTQDMNRQNAETFLWDRLAAYYQTMAKPFVQGRDLIEAGLVPSVKFTEILNHAHKLRLAGVDKSDALKQTMGYARSIGAKPMKHDERSDTR